MFNHFGTVSAIIGVWFGACVSGVVDPLLASPKEKSTSYAKGYRLIEM